MRPGSVVDEFTARASVDESAAFRPFSPSLRFKMGCVHLKDRAPSKVAMEFLEVFGKVLREGREAVSEVGGAPGLLTQTNL